MSYSKDIKEELCGLDITKPCCRRALLYGMLLFSTVFSREKLKMVTESKGAAELFLSLLDALYGIPGNLYESEKKSPEPAAAAGETIYTDADHDAVKGKKVRKSYKITVPQKKEIEKMAELFDESSPSPYRIRPELLECPQCRAALVRGAFLASGTVSDPRVSSYHLELSTAYRNLSFDMAELLSDLGLPPKLTTRKNSYVIYYKESEKIEDFLTSIGASRAVFMLINCKIVKDLRNNTNRVVNCETANIGKSIKAAGAVAAAVDKLKKEGIFDTLPEDLKQAALLRVEHQDISLKELGEMMTPKLTKSGVNHRLQKILEYGK